MVTWLNVARVPSFDWYGWYGVLWLWRLVRCGVVPADAADVPSRSAARLPTWVSFLSSSSWPFFTYKFLWQVWSCTSRCSRCSKPIRRPASQVGLLSFTFFVALLLRYINYCGCAWRLVTGVEWYEPMHQIVQANAQVPNAPEAPPPGFPPLPGLITDFHGSFTPDGTWIPGFHIRALLPPHPTIPHARIAMPTPAEEEAYLMRALIPSKAETAVQHGLNRRRSRRRLQRKIRQGWWG